MVEAVKLRLERDDQAVQLITIHRSKGLEYPVVYCPYLWDGGGLFPDEEDNLLYHDPEQDHHLKIDVRIKGTRKDREADPHIELAKQEKAAENLRLLYVAVTRARHRCVVVWGGFYKSHRSPLGYLLGSPLHGDHLPWDPDAVAAKLKELDDEPMLAWLKERGAGAWAITRLDEGQAIPYRPPPVADVEIRARRPVAAIDRSRRTASFTTMIADRELPRQVGEGRDRDEITPDAPRTGPLPAPEGPIPLAEFPRGAKAGNFFHDVLENLDFMAPVDEREALIDAKLAAYGYPQQTWAEPVRRALHGVLDTPLLPGDPTLRLSSIGPSRRRNELEFILPTAGGEREEAIALTRERLAALFRRHGEGLPPGYPEQVDRLGFSPLRGFLKGFIDLVIVHRDRWYLADYKTNHLGDDLGAYAPPRLGQTMVEDHYVLQYHLYTVALVRHLARTVPGFRYERDFGGVFYLFLRGMTPAAGPTRGVFFDRPPLARIEALSDLLRGGPIE
jgi:exodeoxyribonuclease V beta subunit